MNQTQFSNIILDQSAYPHWVIDSNYKLIYANKAFESFVVKVSGEIKKLEGTIFFEFLSKHYEKAWKRYYDRALQGESFEVEEQFTRKISSENYFYRISFQPLTNEENEYYAVACHSKEITALESKFEINSKQEKEQIIQEIESGLDTLFKTIPDILCLTDLSGRILKINGAACSLLGYTKEELLQKNLNDFTYPADLDSVIKAFNRLKEGESVIKFENRFLSKKGDILWLSWSCNTDLDNEMVTATAKDISQEKKLRKLNKQARDLAKVGSWEYDPIEDQLFWSDEVHRLHQTDPNTFVPTVGEALEFYKEEQKSYVSDVTNKAFDEGTSLEYEAAIISKNNEEKWIRVIASPEYIEGVCVKFIGSFQDITDLKEANARLQSLSDNIPGLVYQYLLFPDGRDEFRYMSKGFQKIWSYSAEQVRDNLDLVWNQIKAGGDYEAVKKSIADSVESKSIWSVRFRIIRPDGEKRVLQASGRPNFGSNGIVLFDSLVLDVTAETESEELLKDLNQKLEKHAHELEYSNAKLKEIAWTQSHVVRAPVSRILGIINLLESKKEISDELSDWLHHLKKSTQELDEIVKKIIYEANDFRNEKTD